jgi:hypothetical protein
LSIDFKKSPRKFAILYLKTPHVHISTGEPGGDALRFLSVVEPQLLFAPFVCV